MSIKKSSIQQALIEAREIEKSALDKAKKALEEELAPKIKQVAKEALKELEEETLKEDVTIKISTDGETVIETPEVTNSVDDIEDIDNTELETELNNTEDEMEEDIFEIEGLDEVDATPTDVAPPAENPVPAPTAEVPALEAPTEPTVEATTLETVNKKLDDILTKIDSISNDGSENSGETEGDVAIIDDEAPNAETVPALENPAPEVAAPAPALQEDEFELDDDNSEEVVYEMEDDGTENEVVYEFEEELNELNSDSIMEMFNEIEETDEIQIVDETENELDEMLGVSFSAQNRAGREGQAKAKTHNPQAPLSQKALKESIDNIKAQYGSKVDEQNQEIERLKQTIKEYKESFIVIRKQINEVQIFNAKLAYANKLFTNGGLTNDEKVKIAEDFDKVETIEEAKKLYNTFLSEMTTSKSPKNTTVEKLRSASPAVATTTSNAQTLFESDEMRRMKRLAGISKKSEE